jgi:hypothetical protein
LAATFAVAAASAFLPPGTAAADVWTKDFKAMEVFQHDRTRRQFDRPLHSVAPLHVTIVGGLGDDQILEFADKVSVRGVGGKSGVSARRA